MNLAKKLCYILSISSLLLPLLFVLNFKQDSKAGDFPSNVANSRNDNVSRGGDLINL
ncbi:hypothetical protein XA3_03630 [Xylocopilactobacillus apicola]|uniref:Uncharacterized protein n=1 Tax=Xylocopilactobacillus apicola TaxID=2932184 RepID=A0AAU9CVB4_9LACO|nr:hypothetical protein XA3_03630 [Xylocopilactobacillus apicola]